MFPLLGAWSSQQTLFLSKMGTCWWNKFRLGHEFQQCNTGVAILMGCYKIYFHYFSISALSSGMWSSNNNNNNNNNNNIQQPRTTSSNNIQQPRTTFQVSRHLDQLWWSTNLLRSIGHKSKLQNPSPNRRARSIVSLTWGWFFPASNEMVSFSVWMISCIKACQYHHDHHRHHLIASSSWSSSSSDCH